MKVFICRAFYLLISTLARHGKFIGKRGKICETILKFLYFHIYAKSRARTVPMLLIDAI
jgi:predicted RNA-binding protein YlqC (UPF0109 family)